MRHECGRRRQMALDGGQRRLHASRQRHELMADDHTYSEIRSLCPTLQVTAFTCGVITVLFFHPVAYSCCPFTSLQFRKTCITQAQLQWVQAGAANVARSCMLTPVPPTAWQPTPASCFNGHASISYCFTPSRLLPPAALGAPPH